MIPPICLDEIVARIPNEPETARQSIGSKVNEKHNTLLSKTLLEGTIDTLITGSITLLEGQGDLKGNPELFNSKISSKKKRKSRTAFTNHQIFELEKRFLYQKYLSPADRDELSAALGLSNAQVITWFQNRRAKLKRDMEELKKDIDAAKLLNLHKTYIDNIQELGLSKIKLDKSSQELTLGKIKFDKESFLAAERLASLSGKIVASQHSS
ncbi:unnamed protein product [Cyprideis torosa]|uniref:Uncharacterized protein n=1 Tax=Cyprideis torosa TaxID=163714 RepID=A0A7R8WBF2_9CRUS|nr:unnamed protein product [Cyprideis torosa]CAG0892235.1 unnamed protein product [Cyprideis torosa]